MQDSSSASITSSLTAVLFQPEANLQTLENETTVLTLSEQFSQLAKRGENGLRSQKDTVDTQNLVTKRSGLQ